MAINQKDMKEEIYSSARKIESIYGEVERESISLSKARQETRTIIEQLFLSEMQKHLGKRKLVRIVHSMGYGSLSDVARDNKFSRQYVSKIKERLTSVEANGKKYYKL